MNLFNIAVLIMFSALLGYFVGIVIGLKQTLPVTPKFILTTWPCRGHNITYRDQKKLHWKYSFEILNDIYSQYFLLSIPLDDLQGTIFRNILKGNYDYS